MSELAERVVFTNVALAVLLAASLLYDYLPAGPVAAGWGALVFIPWGLGVTGSVAGLISLAAYGAGRLRGLLDEWLS